MIRVPCGGFLANIPALKPGPDVVMPCDCGCGRVWQLRTRTRWLTYAPWYRSAPGRTADTVWVRLSSWRSQALLVAREREC